MTMLVIGALTVFAVPVYSCLTETGFYEENEWAGRAFFTGLLVVLLCVALVGV